MRSIDKLFESLKLKLKLPENSTLDELSLSIDSLVSDNLKLSAEISDIKNSFSVVEDLYRNLLADSNINELNYNLAALALYEMNSALCKLVSDREIFQDHYYLPYLYESIQKLVNVDIIRHKNVLEEYRESVNTLKTNLERKIEEHSELKMGIASIMSDGGCVSLENFDSDFKDFSVLLDGLREKAKKYDFLIGSGSIREVGSTISAKSAFHVTVNL